MSFKLKFARKTIIAAGNVLYTAPNLSFNLCFASPFSCATLFPGMISIATKRITTPTSMSITSTKAKKTIFASGAWRNS